MPHRPHPRYANRLKVLARQGEFIPSKPGTLGLGYELWARHPDGDIILRCIGNAGWFDWFTPVRERETPDFVLMFEGRGYRLVRGVDVVPPPFVVCADVDGRSAVSSRRYFASTALNGATE